MENNEFVKTVKAINDRYDARGPGGCFMSVTDMGDLVELVIGASYYDKHQCMFSSKTLGDLINVLTDIQQAMLEKEKSNEV